MYPYNPYDPYNQTGYQPQYDLQAQYQQYIDPVEQVNPYDQTPTIPTSNLFPGAGNRQLENTVERHTRRLNRLNQRFTYSRKQTEHSIFSIRRRILISKIKNI